MFVKKKIGHYMLYRPKGYHVCPVSSGVRTGVREGGEGVGILRDRVHVGHGRHIGLGMIDVTFWTE